MSSNNADDFFLFPSQAWDKLVCFEVCEKYLLHVCESLKVFCNLGWLVYHSVRNCSHKTVPGSRYVKPLAGVKQYLVQKCFTFIRSYELILEKKFPRAFKVYQVFSVGTKELYTDVREYIRISQELRKGKAVRDLKRKELEIYFQVPKDLLKVSPTLAIAAFPFANYVIFPLAYAFPKQFLSSHFWSLQQKVDFALKAQRRKLLHYRPVFRIIQSKVKNIEDASLKDVCSNIFYKIGSGDHPPISDIIKVKPLFEDGPYSLYSLTSMHLTGLCRLHDLSTRLGKRHRLWNHAGFIREMDLAILREGLHEMSLEELRRACFLRGLNPLGQSKEEIATWLQQWIDVSINLDRNSLSLLLHLPLFLAYNRPSNWGLIH